MKISSIVGGLALGILGIVALTGESKAAYVAVDCNTFNGLNIMCVNNQSNYSVAYILCDGRRVDINAIGSNGFIPGNTMGTATFPVRFCSQVVYYITDGRQRGGDPIDAKATNVVTIKPWVW